MARKFFYVSAGILMLTLSYNLGASRALAQSGHRLVHGEAWNPSGVDENGQLWAIQSNGSYASGPIQPPRAGTIIDVSIGIAGGSPSGTVLYDDGDIFRLDQGSWAHVTNVFAGATAATPTTLGRVKATYR